MFTFRAERHDGARSVFESASYLVENLPELDRQEIRLYNGGSSDEMIERLYVGPREPFARVYVMNAAGKTVDVVR